MKVRGLLSLRITTCCTHDDLSPLQRLAVGTSKGMLVVYQLLESEREEDLQYNTVIEMSAHPPQPGPQDQRFGQLGKQ